MSRSDRDKWNARYRDGAYAGRDHPSPLVAEYAPDIAATQHKKRRDADGEPLRALDLACGAGRNALYLATLGYAVDALDISAEALRRGQQQARRRRLPVSWIEHDLDRGLPRALGRYDFIVIIRYLDLSLVTAAADRLLPGGYLLCEAHLETDEAVIGPRDPNFRARRGEMRAAVPTLHCLEYWEGTTRDPDGRAVALARLVAWEPYPRP